MATYLFTYGSTCMYVSAYISDGKYVETLRRNEKWQNWLVNFTALCTVCTPSYYILQHNGDGTVICSRCRVLYYISYYFCGSNTCKYKQSRMHVACTTKKTDVENRYLTCRVLNYISCYIIGSNTCKYKQGWMHVTCTTEKNQRKK